MSWKRKEWNEVQINLHLFLVFFFIPILFAKNRERMSLCVEDPVFKWKEIIFRKQQIQVPGKKKKQEMRPHQGSDFQENIFRLLKC